MQEIQGRLAIRKAYMPGCDMQMSPTCLVSTARSPASRRPSSNGCVPLCHFSQNYPLILRNPQITYLLILHPIAAGFSTISVILGLIAHTHGFAGTAFTTCFASFAATFALLAFIFDIVVFVIAKSRIQSSAVGGSAQLGNVGRARLSLTLASIHTSLYSHVCAYRLSG